MIIYLKVKIASHIFNCRCKLPFWQEMSGYSRELKASKCYNKNCLTCAQIFWIREEYNFNILIRHSVLEKSLVYCLKFWLIHFCLEAPFCLGFKYLDVINFIITDESCLCGRINIYFSNAHSISSSLHSSALFLGQKKLPLNVYIEENWGIHYFITLLNLLILPEGDIMQMGWQKQTVIYRNIRFCIFSANKNRSITCLLVYYNYYIRFMRMFCLDCWLLIWFVKSTVF